MIESPRGLALYLRRIQRKRHGTPRSFAAKAADYGLRWMAIAGPWHDHNGPRMINPPRTCRAYADALEARNIKTFIWGYPYQGTEARFAREMRECSGEHKRGLLDPELGSNPTRSRKGAGKARAEKHAAFLVERMDVEGFEQVLLSTFGSGWRLGWFPLLAFTRALIKHYGGRTAIGGQTYTDDGRIDMSIADMQTAIRRAGGHVILPGALQGASALTSGVEVIPNFGTYSWEKKDPSKVLSSKNRRARPKRPEELRLHLHEFVNENEPVDAMIGWAENFMNQRLWTELASFAALMERGACRL